MTRRQITDKELEEAVKQSTSMADVLRYFGLKLAGGSQTHYKKRIVSAGIDTTHFLGKGHKKGKTAGNRKTPEEILVILPEGSYRPKVAQLRRAMLEVGVVYECADTSCILKDVWNGKPLVLEVDHINGDFLNNLITNLRFLCPNCHSQQTLTNSPYRDEISIETT